MVSFVCGVEKNFSGVTKSEIYHTKKKFSELTTISEKSFICDVYVHLGQKRGCPSISILKLTKHLHIPQFHNRQTYIYIYELCPFHFHSVVINF